MSDMRLWCLLKGEDAPFPIVASPTTFIATLKDLIKRRKGDTLQRVDASDLKLWKVNVDLDGIIGDIRRGKYQFDTHGRPLPGPAKLSSVWQQPWPSDSDDRPQLHVYITLPADMGSPLVDTVGQQIGHADFLQPYKEIFIKVKNWGCFEESDVARNWIESAKENGVVIPDFVKIFERKLVRKPRLHADMVTAFGIAGSYFGTSEDMIEDEDEPLGEPRYADESEIFHTLFVSRFYWEKAWQPGGRDQCPLKGKVVDAMFFYPLIYASPNDTPPTLRRDKRTPITFPVKCESERPRKYKPRSGFMISHSSLPRLLVEVNSTSMDVWPMELVRMLTMGAFIVRFANRFLKPFCDEKNFVLCAIYIWENGNAACYSLFQRTLPNQIDNMVYYNRTELSLNRSAGRIEFVRHLYNLLWLELDQDQDQDQDTRATILEHNSRIESQLDKPMFTNSGRKRASTSNTSRNGNRVGEGGGDDRAQLRAHGYETKPEVIVDARGDEWAPLFEMPDHILIVYRPMDSNKEFIAKKVREDSNELDMLRLFDTFPLKSDHVISLIDSFHGWAILPKMVTVKDYAMCPPNLSWRKVSQICLGLIKGLAYLHEHRIAHRDIKPDNLVLNENLYLKIIDFDTAMRVEGEDEEVDDQCGTKNWMAPEVEKELRHSPIKADRWACGRVLLFLLDKLGKEDQSLRGFARNLMAYNPTHRPSLLEWRNDLAPPFSDLGTVLN